MLAPWVLVITLYTFVSPDEGSGSCDPVAMTTIEMPSQANCEAAMTTVQEAWRERRLLVHAVCLPRYQWFDKDGVLHKGVKRDT